MLVYDMVSLWLRIDQTADRKVFSRKGYSPSVLLLLSCARLRHLL